MAEALRLPLTAFGGEKSFSHGIHPREEKEITRHLPIRRFPFAPFLVLLLSQHAGRPAVPVVRERQEVRRGELLARADGFVSAPIHAPAAGVVHSIGRALDMNGRPSPAIVLRPFPGEHQQVPSLAVVDPDSLNAKGIVNAIRDMGMVGLGGAAFPTHVKFTPPEGKHLDTLIVNGCECEPYLTADERVMLEQTEQVLLGTRLMARALGVARTIIAVESNKPEAAAKLRAALPAGLGIEVEVLATKYPQGAEKMLTRALLGRDVPSGGLPIDVGVMVSNVTTAAEIGLLLPQGLGLIERVITISGRGVRRPGNYLMPLGTPLTFVMEQVGLESTAGEIVFGGPMMGKAVAHEETPITKGVSGILVLAQDELAPAQKVYPCIRCAACVDACPMHLNPSRLGILASMRRYDEMAADYHLFDCFECGCCSYVCPSHIPLVQEFRAAKLVQRKRKEAS